MSENERFSTPFGEAVADIGSNLALWAFTWFGIGVIAAFAGVFDANCRLTPILEFLHFVDPKLWVAQVTGGVLLIGMTVALKFEEQTATMGRIHRKVIEEFAGVFKNFGSLMLTSSVAFLVISLRVQPPGDVQAERAMAIVSVFLGSVNLAWCFWRTFRLAQRRGGSIEQPESIVHRDDEHEKSKGQKQKNADNSRFGGVGRGSLGHGGVLGGQSHTQAESWSVSIARGRPWRWSVTLAPSLGLHPVGVIGLAWVGPMCPAEGLKGSSGAIR